MTLDNLVIIAKGYCDLYHRDLVVSNFLKDKDEKLDILILNISAIIVFSVSILSEYKRDFTK